MGLFTNKKRNKAWAAIGIVEIFFERYSRAYINNISVEEWREHNHYDNLDFWGHSYNSYSLNKRKSSCFFFSIDMIFNIMNYSIFPDFADKFIHSAKSDDLSLFIKKGTIKDIEKMHKEFEVVMNNALTAYKSYKITHILFDSDVIFYRMEQDLAIIAIQYNASIKKFNSLTKYEKE